MYLRILILALAVTLLPSIAHAIGCLPGYVSIGCPPPMRYAPPQPRITAQPEPYPGPDAPGNAGPEWDRRHPAEAQQRQQAEFDQQQQRWAATKAEPLTPLEAQALKIKQETEARWGIGEPTEQITPPGTAAIYALFECSARDQCVLVERFDDLESCRRTKREFDSNFPKNQENFIREGHFFLAIYVCSAKFVPIWTAR